MVLNSLPVVFYNRPTSSIAWTGSTDGVMLTMYFNEHGLSSERNEGLLTPPPDVENDVDLTTTTATADNLINPTSDYRTLVLAADARDMYKVQKMFDHGRPLRPAEDPRDVERLSDIMLDAIDRDEPLLAAYLVAFEVPFGVKHVEKALSRRRKSLVELFVQSGWDINQRAADGMPLLVKVLADTDFAEWFLSLGADPNVLSPQGVTPLSIAVSRYTVDLVEVMLQYNGNIHTGQLMHFAACRADLHGVEVAKLLIQQGARLDRLMCEDDRIAFQRHAKNGLGAPLHYAANVGTLEMVRTLLQHGADPLQLNTLKKSSIDLARDIGRTAVVELIQSYCKKPTPDREAKRQGLTVADLCN